jgi:phosphatidylserine decarboxylase
MTGRFEMGSTIVMIFESPRDSTSFLIEEGQQVSLGEPIVETEAKATHSNQIIRL